MDWLHFLNLQFWYCVIYSFFGGSCGRPDLDTDAGSGGWFGWLQSDVGTSTRAGTEGGVWGVITRALDSFTDTILSLSSALANSIVGQAVVWLWDTYSALAYTVSGFLAFSIFSALIGLALIRFREVYAFGYRSPRLVEAPKASRWQELLNEVTTHDPKRWRSALLEADRMLGELLGTLGYEGVTTAEKMRRLPDEAFVTVPVAWEAHRIRNFVSSASSDFVLTQREAFRVMKLYEQVFEEFHIV